MEQLCDQKEEKSLCKGRPKSAFAVLESRAEQQFKQFSANILNEINCQLKPQYQQNSRPKLEDDPQPCSSNLKWKPSKFCPVPVVKQKKPVYKKKLNPRAIERLSFETKLMKLEQLHPLLNKDKPMSCVKFPSQKTLLSKEKLVPVQPAEKEKYVIEICRIFKENCNTIYEENNKEHQAFKEIQAKKVKNVQQHEKNKPPSSFAFNYDGSIMTVNPVKKTRNQLIECIGQQLHELTIQPLNPNGTTDNNNADPSSTDFQKLQTFDSSYVENFQKIKWNPKITVETSTKFRTSQTENQPSVNANLGKNREKEMVNGFDRNRATTISAGKEVVDEKSFIKIFNSRAYEEHLITRPVQINGKRSNTGNSQLSDDQRPFTLGPAQEKKNQKSNPRCKSAHTASIGRHQAFQIPHKKANQSSKQDKTAQRAANIREQMLKFEVEKGNREVRKYGKLRPAYRNG